MLIIGCDFHSRFQQIATLDPQTGEVIERRLEHEQRGSGVLRRACHSGASRNGGHRICTMVRTDAR